MEQLGLVISGGDFLFEGMEAPRDFRSNGLVSLGLDRAEYTAGESPVLSIHERASPGQGFEYQFKADVNGASVALKRLGDRLSAGTLPVLGEGQHALAVDMFLRDSRVAGELEGLISALARDLEIVGQKLTKARGRERQRLLEEQEALYNRRESAQVALDSLSVRVGERLRAVITVRAE